MTEGFLTDDGALARRSRYGDNHAARRLAVRHLDRIAQLAAAVAGNREDAAGLTRRGFRMALRCGRPFEDALVRAFGRLAAEREDAEEAQGRLLVLLVEVEGRPSAEVASLLGLSAAAARALLPGARASLGQAPPARSCRGWGLLASPGSLTTAERLAGEKHLALCRRCRDRRAAIERTRAQLLGSSAGVAGAVAATQLGSFGGTAGLTVALGGKAGIAVVGTAASAILATASTVAVTEPQRFHPPAGAVVVSTTSTPSAAPATPSAAPTRAPLPTSSPAASVLPSLPVPLPTGVPRSRTPLPGPTDLPLPLPTALLPTSIPLPLPTGLPLPLPTELEVPDLVP